MFRLPPNLKKAMNGSYLQMIKALDVAAKSTASARYKYAKILSILSSHEGTERGFSKTISCMAPNGQTAAQKTLPKNSVNIKGRRKKPLL